MSYTVLFDLSPSRPRHQNLVFWWNFHPKSSSTPLSRSAGREKQSRRCVYCTVFCASQRQEAHRSAEVNMNRRSTCERYPRRQPFAPRIVVETHRFLQFLWRLASFLSHKTSCTRPNIEHETLFKSPDSVYVTDESTRKTRIKWCVATMHTPVSSENEQRVLQYVCLIHPYIPSICYVQRAL